jgi:alpha-glucosidase (family GH31 glycosyl hydrolase)
MRILLLSIVFFLHGQLGFSQIVNPIVLGKIRFTVITPELIRMEYATDGKFIDEQTLFANNRSALFNDFKLTKNGNIITITTNRLELQFISDGLPFSNKNIKATIYNKPANYEWRIFSKEEKNLGGTLTTLDGLTDSVKTDNGLLSRNGWEIIDDSGKEIFKNDWIAERPVNHLRDVYLFAYGQDYKAALQALTTISGQVPMTRKYVHGSWYCRWWNYSENDYLKIVDEYKKHDFPLDVLVLDMGWHTQKQATTGMGHANNYGWTGYSWNKTLIPDPAGFIKKLKDDHIAVTLNDHPHDGIRHHEEQYASFMKAMHQDTANQTELLFNAGDKVYMDNFLKFALKPNEDIGVDFWWLDWQQDYEMPHVLGFRNLKHLPWINYLYFQHSASANQRGLLFSRWAGWGSQRTPIQFSGDAKSTWEMLKFEVPFTANSGNSGCFFWAHDIGGFFGVRNVEQYIRWTQFGLTTSSLRIHSVTDTTLDRRPWLWGKQAEAAMKTIYHLRSQLMPYIYSSVWQSHSQSIPLNRGMYIDYADKEEAYHTPQQFMFGDLLLSAPIVSPGTGENFISSQNVWFPEGSKWYNIFNNEVQEGGQIKKISAAISEFPLYVKGGFPLPMQPYRQRMASAVLDTLVIRCYPGNIGQSNIFNLYEDDGISNDYIKGNNALTGLHYQQKHDGAIITIDAVKGSGYEGQPQQRSYQIELPDIILKGAFVNGKKLKISKNEAINGYVITVPLTSIHQSLSIIVTQ